MAKIQIIAAPSSASSKDTLVKRQWSKFISKGNALTLMHFNQDSPLFKSYKNTSYCSELLQTDEVGKVKTTYCKNKWCLTCSRIKTARLINNYHSQLEELTDPQFLTLTLPTVDKDHLEKRISDMEKTWRLIYKKASKSKYKKIYTILKGVRKAEITIRPNGQYHYHFHFIIDNKPQAEWLLKQWLIYNPTANPKAQDLRSADEGSFKELFKYAFKAEIKTSNKINAKRYDLVFQALRRKRTYQAFGGIKKIEEDFTEDDLKNGIILEGYPLRTFTWVTSDWYDKETGGALLNLSIPDKVKDLTNYPKTNKIQ